MSARQTKIPLQSAFVVHFFKHSIENIGVTGLGTHVVPVVQSAAVVQSSVQKLTPVVAPANAPPQTAHRRQSVTGSPTGPSSPSGSPGGASATASVTAESRLSASGDASAPGDAPLELDEHPARAVRDDARHKKAPAEPAFAASNENRRKVMRFISGPSTGRRDAHQWSLRGHC